MNEKELLKLCKRKQEEFIEAEKKKYQQALEEFKKGDEADVQNLYFNTNTIEVFNINSYPWTLEGIKELCDDAKKSLDDIDRTKYIKPFVSGIEKEIEDIDGYYVNTFDGLKVRAFYVVEESSVYSRAKSNFIEWIANEMRDYAIKKKYVKENQWKRNPDCALLEGFLNEEVTYEFIVKATYKNCSI